MLWAVVLLLCLVRADSQEDKMKIQSITSSTSTQLPFVNLKEEIPDIKNISVLTFASDTIEGREVERNSSSDSGNNEKFMILDGSRSQENMNSTRGLQAIFMARNEVSFGECKGTVNGSTLRITPSGNKCELLLRRSNNDTCHLEIETIGWAGECRDTWLEAGGTLECGDVSPKRTVPLGDKGVLLRFTSVRGILVARQKPCVGHRPQVVADRFGEVDQQVGVHQGDPLRPIQQSPVYQSGVPDCGGQPCSGHDSNNQNIQVIQETEGYYPSNVTTLLGSTDRQDWPGAGGGYPPYNAPRDAVWEVYNPGYPSPSTTSGDCFLSLPLPPSCSPARLVFSDFQVGRVDGGRGRCEEGWLEVGGFRFCGCQTGLAWTPPNPPRNGVLEMAFRGPGRFRILVTVTPSREFLPVRDLRWRCDPPPPLPVPPPTPSQCPLLPWNRGTINISPNPANFCYRFDEENSIGCGTMVRLDDVRMRANPGCYGDYIMAGPQRHCQFNTPVTMMLNRGECLRGRIGGDSKIRATYSTMMCSCDGHFRQPQVAIKGPEASTCTYTIHKALQEVCGLDLVIENLNLDCRFESLYAGGKFYCGNIIRKRVNIPFYDPSTTVRYENRGNSQRGNYLIQINQRTDCINSVFNDRGTNDWERCLIPLNGMSGEVKSPSDLPARPTTCAYLFTPTKGICWIRLDFNKFELSDSPDCKNHHFKIDGENFCGGSLSFKTKVVAVKEGRVLLEYAASRDDSWSFRYSQLPCGQQLAANYQQIKP